MCDCLSCGQSVNQRLFDVRFGVFVVARSCVVASPSCVNKHASKHQCARGCCVDSHRVTVRPSWSMRFFVSTPSIHVSLPDAQTRATCLRERVSRCSAADGLPSCCFPLCVPSCRCGTLSAALTARPLAVRHLRPAQLLQRAMCERMPRGHVADVRCVQLFVVSSRV